jgi:hypothetical protein
MKHSVESTLNEASSYSSRRHFLRGIGCGSLAAIAASHFSGCSGDGAGRTSNGQTTAPITDVNVEFVLNERVTGVLQYPVSNGLIDIRFSDLADNDISATKWDPKFMVARTKVAGKLGAKLEQTVNGQMLVQAIVANMRVHGFEKGPDYAFYYNRTREDPLIAPIGHYLYGDKRDFTYRLFEDGESPHSGFVARHADDTMSLIQNAVNEFHRIFTHNGVEYLTLKPKPAGESGEADLIFGVGEMPPGYGGAHGRNSNWAMVNAVMSNPEVRKAAMIEEIFEVLTMSQNAGSGQATVTWLLEEASYRYFIGKISDEGAKIANFGIGFPRP